MITFDGIDDTISLLGNASDTNKIQEFLTRLAEIGVEVAERHYNSVPSEYGNIEYPTVSFEVIDNNNVCVVATGTDVLFLEFGTGITYAEPYPQDEGFEPTFKMGDWSDNEELGGKGHWDNPNGWYLPKPYPSGSRTKGIAPERAMYEAKKEMKKNIERIAKEVFKI